ncbi:MAG: Membrane protein insertase YidC [Verrucomicrobiaceae bacterium]|nr:Membrane protein insertase YidC [Verrucomicrobiaceae bacterium]
MDRKAWIVVTLCCILMGANAWYMSDQADKAKAYAAAHPAQAKMPDAAPVPGAVAAATPGAPGAITASLPEETRELKVDSVRYILTTKGGGVKEADLSATDKVVLNRLGRDAIGAFRREAKTTDATPYKIVDSTDKAVTFEGTTADNLLIRKTFTLTEGPGSDPHLLKMTLTLTNKGAEAHKSDQHFIYTGAADSLRPDDIIRPAFFWNNGGDSSEKDTAKFAGGLMSSAQNEMNEGPFNDFRFGGVMSRFYASIVSTVEQPGVLVPGRMWAETFHVDHSSDVFKDNSSSKNDLAIHGAIGMAPVDLAPGASKTVNYEIYLGPKEYRRLADLGRHREDVMFYGMWGFISKILTGIMRWMHDKTGNWGVAIMLLTIVIRTVLWPVQAKAQRSMKRMGKLSPLMKEIQTKYKDDPSRMNTEVMKLYKEYGVNPVGGCLPMFIQIPIFFGFFAMLKSAAELRGQSFGGWVHDLSLPDTVATWHLPFSLPLLGDHFDINPLPLIMVATMVAQMKLTPQPATVDKTQKNMMMLMPVMFLWFSYSYAAALALYWATSNLYMIAQTWIMRALNPNDEAPLQKVVQLPKGPLPSASGQKPKDKKPKQPRLGG